MEHPHRRYNPLTGDWVLVSPHRSSRPWTGQVEKPTFQDEVDHDGSCFLCPGNTRSNNKKNPNYRDTFVFTNDFSALYPNPVEEKISTNPLFRRETAAGLCRVVCFSPNHSETIPELTITQLQRLLETFNDQILELSESYIWIQVFENKGEVMGCSQPHPHGQIWASNFLPTEIARKESCQRSYQQNHGTSLLLDYANAEKADGARIVVETRHWLAVVPYWAGWPFETLLLPKTSVQRMQQLDVEQRADLAIAIKKLTSRYDNLFHTPFPYSMGWHYAPFFPEDQDISHWQLHAVYYPPLLRSATVKKHMVGYEMLAELQRDLTPEAAAEKLRAVSDIHYKESAL